MVWSSSNEYRLLLILLLAGSVKSKNRPFTTRWKVPRHPPENSLRSPNKVAQMVHTQLLLKAVLGLLPGRLNKNNDPKRNLLRELDFVFYSLELFWEATTAQEKQVPLRSKVDYKVAFCFWGQNAMIILTLTIRESTCFFHFFRVLRFLSLRDCHDTSIVHEHINALP